MHESGRAERETLLDRPFAKERWPVAVSETLEGYALRLPPAATGAGRPAWSQRRRSAGSPTWRTSLLGKSAASR